MKSTVNRENFREFNDGFWDYDYETQKHKTFWLKPENMDVSGGRMHVDELKVLFDYPGLKEIQISGLDQDSFEYFIKNFGHQFSLIRFFKNKDIKDWSLLSTLNQIESLDFYYNNYIDHFWDMSQNTSLKYLSIDNFKKLQTLEGIEKAQNLECFYIGNKLPDSSSIDSLKWFAHTNIYDIEIGKLIDDLNLSYVKDMPNLSKVPLIYDVTLEQFAWLSANVPEKMDNALPYIEYEGYSETGDAPIRIKFLDGSRSFKKTPKNEKRIQAYMERFEVLKEYYKDKPYPIEQ